MPRTAPPIALFGAFDRHNFGDLLFPHVVAALLPGRQFSHFGLRAADLTAWGGHRTSAIAAGPPPAAVVHAGGEILSCAALEAATMLASPATVSEIQEQAPYVLAARAILPGAPRIFNAVGGVELPVRPPPFIAEVMEKLEGAAHVGVRDRQTRDFLAGRGIAADLAPDPAVLVAELFAEPIARHADDGPVAAVLKAFPAGYLALQFSADFGDDGTLDGMAEELRRLPAHLGIAAFCAGLAPWHDDPEVYRRLLPRLAGRPALVFASPHLWDICALLAHAAAYAGSSLHGRIVATAFGVPAVSLTRPGEAGGKVAAYVATWEPDHAPATVAPPGLADALVAALGGDRTRQRDRAAALATAYRQYASRWLPLLG